MSSQTFVFLLTSLLSYIFLIWIQTKLNLSCRSMYTFFIHFVFDKKWVHDSHEIWNYSSLEIQYFAPSKYFFLKIFCCLGNKIGIETHVKFSKTMFSWLLWIHYSLFGHLAQTVLGTFERIEVDLTVGHYHPIMSLYQKFKKKLNPI